MSTALTTQQATYVGQLIDQQGFEIPLEDVPEGRRAAASSRFGRMVPALNVLTLIEALAIAGDAADFDQANLWMAEHAAEDGLYILDEVGMTNLITQPWLNNAILLALDNAAEDARPALDADDESDGIVERIYEGVFGDDDESSSFSRAVASTAREVYAEPGEAALSAGSVETFNTLQVLARAGILLEYARTNRAEVTPRLAALFEACAMRVLGTIPYNELNVALNVLEVSYHHPGAAQALRELGFKL